MRTGKRQIAKLEERLRRLEAEHRQAQEELRRLRPGDGEESPGVPPAAGARDRSLAIAGDAAHLVVVTGDRNYLALGDGRRVPVEDAGPDLLWRAYLSSLAGECQHLPLGVIDTEFVRTGAASAPGEAAVRLPEVYVDLDVVAAPPREDGDDRGWALRLVHGEVSGRTPLLEALAAGSRRHVVLGDPGSGKTTFAHYLCHALAADLAAGGAAAGESRLPEGWSGRVPVRFVLREVAARHLPAGAERGTAGMLWDGLAANLAEALGETAGGRLFEPLQKRMLEAGAWVILDGLDEVPEAGRRREVLVQAVTAFAGELESSHVLVTARPYAYADPRWQLPGFETVALAPFDRRQVDGFVERWYLTAARRVFGWSEDTARDKARQLRTALDARPFLGDLASRPLLLTLMATLHSSWGQLPEDRADLYEETVKLLLSRWQRQREVTAPSGEKVIEPAVAEVLAVDESRLRRALERLAYAVHERQGREAAAGEGVDGAPADISRGEVVTAFEPLLGEVSADRLLAYLEDRAGLLISRRQGIYAFPHRSFQEYLAACHLGALPDPGEEIRRHVFDDPRWWREVALLAVNRGKRGGLGNAVGMLSLLQPGDPAGEARVAAWQAAIVCGHAALELRLLEALEERGHYGAVVERVQKWLVALVEGGHLGAKDRAEAGDLLGRLEDPRPGVRAITVESSKVPDVTWLEVPAGEFTLGAGEDDDLAWPWDKPAHPCRLGGFWISRYAITNAQFRPFVEEGGYAERGWWTEAGWRWRHGEAPELSVYEDLPEETQKAIADWLAKRPREKRDRPFFYGDPRWGGASRPAVGVTWYEAQAWCRWLEARYRELGAVPGVTAALPAEVAVRLPTEAEWEKAARGDDRRRWPWKGDFDPERCNSAKSGVGETAAVGVFPGGRSPYGLDDAAGNVWEWTATTWDPKKYGYPYRDDDGREDVEGRVPRVVRGGSYFNNRDPVRCAARLGSDPGRFNGLLGFRCVLSLANSES